MRKLLGKKQTAAIVAVLVMCVSLSSCENVRKKFVRQKKKGAEDADFVPVLEPQDYPSPENNPRLMYSQHYDLIKAWYRDLWPPLESRYPMGSAKPALKEISGHIDEMQKLLKPELQPKLDKLRGYLKSYYDSLDQPPVMRNVARIESDLRAFYHVLLADFTPAKAKAHLVPATPEGAALPAARK